MNRVALVLVIILAFLAPDVRADDRADALERHAWKLKVGGEVTVGIAGVLLVATAVRLAAPNATTTSCGDPCLDHARVRDMGILAGGATVAFAIGIPLLLYAHRDHRRAFRLRGPTLVASF